MLKIYNIEGTNLTTILPEKVAKVHNRRIVRHEDQNGNFVYDYIDTDYLTFRNAVLALMAEGNIGKVLRRANLLWQPHMSLRLRNIS